LPLILAALPEHQHLFHKVSNNLSLLPNGINKSKVYRTRWAGERCLGIWSPIIITPSKICDDYHQAKSQGTSDNIR
jgi:hypothetical protein